MMNRKEMELLRDKLIPTVAEALTMADDVFDEYKRKKKRGQDENPSFDDEPDMKDRMICAQAIMTAGVQLMFMESAKKELAAVKDKEVPAVVEPPGVSSGIPEAKLSPGGPIFIGEPLTPESNVEFIRKATREFITAAKKSGLDKAKIMEVFDFLLSTNDKKYHDKAKVEMLDVLSYMMVLGLDTKVLEENEKKEPGAP